MNPELTESVAKIFVYNNRGTQHRIQNSIVLTIGPNFVKPPKITRGQHSVLGDGCCPWADWELASTGCIVETQHQINMVAGVDN